MRKVLKVSLGVASLVAAGVASSASVANTSFHVTANIASHCSASAADIAFGTYAQGGGTLTANQPVNVKCTTGTAFTVRLNAGTSTGGTLAQRLMTDGAGNFLQYNLYTTAGLATIFGDGTGGTGTGAGTGAGTSTNVPITVYGQLPDNTFNQGAAAASYSDLITVTVSY